MAMAMAGAIGQSAVVPLLGLPADFDFRSLLHYCIESAAQRKFVGPFFIGEIYDKIKVIGQR